MRKQRGHTADFCMLTAELTPSKGQFTQHGAEEKPKIRKMNSNTAHLILYNSLKYTQWITNRLYT